MRTWLLLAWTLASKSNISEEYSQEKGMIAASDIAAAANDGTLTTQMIEHILNDNGIIFIHH